ncbi:hypothetical protein CERZMDRAFT_107190 [Cercospora zeae-maydis SCOH1-5]|uniref:Up-regulated during septation protein 1 domain-containing protein n=1 Tax=Cercospora zeae-maydis SCOH1-5 TaxID=717836 RepID=A0A6A6F659_9PEZI|nr:hypothetical protein CERZMDRAFT_107190 [Cercospora zeae-maydis SCOH1-5]
MERGASPSPTPSSSHGSQDSGRHRKSTASYRLFPIVEPTPPASPVRTVHRQRAGLRKTFSQTRRRSESLGNASRDSTRSSSSSSSSSSSAAAASSSSVAAPPSTLSAKDCRKISLPEIRPLQTVVELDSASAEPSPQLFDSAPVCAHDDHVTIRPASAQGASVIARTADRAPIAFNPRHEHGRVVAQPACATSHFETPALGAVHLQHPTTTAKSKRSKPNLRIKIAGKKSGEPLPRAQARDDSGHPEALLATTGPSLDAARLTNRPATPSSHQQISGDPRPASTTPESTNANKAVTGRQSRKFWPKVLFKEGAPSDASQERRAERDPPHRQLRPSTAGTSTRPPAPVSGPLAAHLAGKPAMYQPSESAQNISQRNIPAGLRSCSSAEQLSSKGGLARPATTGKIITNPPLDGGPFPERISSMDHRMHSGHHAGSHKQEADGNVDATSRSPSMRPEASTALAIARANVAALRESSQWTASDTQLFSRPFTPDAPSRPTPLDVNDPVTMLKNTTEQCDALHARYSSLRAERQKLSSGIIEKLQQEVTTQEGMSALLHEQLSLTAISSSMDICFAKLKSLECRKEDAIAALIAQATEARKSPSDNIAAIIASMSLGSRKPSLTCSVESDSRYAYSSRSSPEPIGRHLPSRSTQSTLPTTVSGNSDTASMEYRLSFTPSLRFDAALQSDFLAPKTIPEAMESPGPSVGQDANRSSEQIDDDMVLTTTKFVGPPTPNTLQDRAREDPVTLDATTVADEEEIEATDLQDDDNDDDESFRHSKRVPGSKAAKFLGLLNKEGRCSPTMTMPRELAHLANFSNVNWETHTQTPMSSKPDPISLASPTEGANALAMQDFSAQLENFPKPSKLSARIRSRAPKELAIPNPLAANPPTPLAETFPDSFDRPPEFSRPPRRDLAMPAGHKVVKRTMTQGSTRTTHTIQVYLGQDDLELFDLYRRGSEGLIVGTAEPVPA